MFSQLWRKIKELISKLTGKSIEQALHIQPMLSNEMTNAIDLWTAMYKDKAPWLSEGTYQHPETVKSLGLPAYIASIKAEMCTLEMKSEITGETAEEVIADEATGLEYTKRTVAESKRAEFLNERYQATIIENIRTQLEYGVAKGGLVIKPYVIGDTIEMDYVQADGFYPIAFNASGRMSEAAFVQKIVNKNETYSRLEHHKLNDNNSVTVINKAFKAPNNSAPDNLGSEIPLSSVPEWADLEPETTVNDVDRLLFAYFKPPIANTIDEYSPLGISVFARAAEQIKEADKQYSRLLWEFEGGELAVNVERDALKYTLNEDGEEYPVMDKLQSRLYRRIDVDPNGLYDVFSPALRDTSILNGLNAIFRSIEDICALSRGTISDPNIEARTATEIVAAEQRSHVATAQLQKALEKTLDDVVYIMDALTTLYNLAPEGKYEVSYEWKDSAKADDETLLGEQTTLMNNGVTSKVEFRMNYMGETEEQAIHALAKVRAYNEFEAQSAIEEGVE